MMHAHLMIQLIECKTSNIVPLRQVSSRGDFGVVGQLAFQLKADTTVPKFNKFTKLAGSPLSTKSATLPLTLSPNYLNQYF